MVEFGITEIKVYWWYCNLLVKGAEIKFIDLCDVKKYFSDNEIGLTCKKEPYYQRVRTEVTYLQLRQVPIHVITGWRTFS